MASMANITVKNAANVDVVYVAKIPSAGDRSPARWTLDASSTIPAHRPQLELVTRDNGTATGRSISASFKARYTQTIAGVETKIAEMPLRLEGTVPTNVDATWVNDMVVQLSNLLASALVRDSVANGYAPT